MNRPSSLRIPLKGRTSEWKDWRWQFKNRFKGLPGLGRLLGTPEAQALKGVIKRYHFASTPYYLSLIDWNNTACPIRRQVIPDPKELSPSPPGAGEDPFLENEFSPVPGLIHRYRDRALLVTTTLCASYCRHCNRKRNWGVRGVSTMTTSKNRKAALEYLNAHREIREVILSGGDPLFLNQSLLEELLKGIRRIGHVDVIRIGTRAPVTLPMRIDKGLCAMLRKYRPIWVNTQFNHPRELTSQAKDAIDRLLSSGIPVCNQAVLLKGVNNDINTLKELFTGLERICVKPYYLFHCDPVSGTDYFRTDISEGISIMSSLWGEIGGLCIPHYVADLPDAAGKALLMPNFLLSLDGGEAIFRTLDGRIQRYPYREGFGEGVADGHKKRKRDLPGLNISQ